MRRSSKSSAQVLSFAQLPPLFHVLPLQNLPVRRDLKVNLRLRCLWSWANTMKSWIRTTSSHQSGRRDAIKQLSVFIPCVKNWASVWHSSIGIRDFGSQGATIWTKGLQALCSSDNRSQGEMWIGWWCSDVLAVFTPWEESLHVPSALPAYEGIHSYDSKLFVTCFTSSCFCN